MQVVGPELLLLVEEAKRRYGAGGDAQNPGIRDWLAHGGSYFVTHSDRSRFTVEAVDNSCFAANGADLAKYYWAANESILPRTDAAYDSRSIGWACVSSYYAGLYLVLGLLRSFGRGMLYLTSDDCSALSYAPGSTKLESGTYSLTVGVGIRPKVDLQKKQTRGFHEGFWRHADDCLATVADEFSTGVGVSRPFSLQIRAAAMLSVEDLRRWLGQPGAVSRGIGWTSSLRNEIHYRLARKVWAPNLAVGGVGVNRLRQDVLGIARGRKDRLGAQLRLDRDVRAMIERNCVLFRDLSRLSGFPQLV